MKRMENMKKYFYGKVKNVGVIKGVGYMPNDEYYIDEETYFFGFKLKSVRYWNQEDYLKKNPPKTKRVTIEGYRKKEVK